MSPRLAVELRILGALGLAWNLTIFHAVVWAWATPGLVSQAQIPWGTLFAPPTIAVLVIAGSLLTDLPATRWPRRPSMSPPRRPWLLLVCGFPVTLLAPIFLVRDHHVKGRSAADPIEVERAFHQLLRAPGATSLRFVAWGGVAAAVDAILLGAHIGWPREAIVGIALLWCALLMPVAAILGGFMRAIVRPEYLSAPRPDAPFRRTTDLRLRLIVNATIASIGVIAAPLCAGFLWFAARGTEPEQTAAHELAERLHALAQHEEAEEMGRLLGENPNVTVRVGLRTFGARRSALPPVSGPYDEDGDGNPDSMAVARGGIVVVAPLPPQARPPMTLYLAASFFPLWAAMWAIMLLARDVFRDVTRATEQAEAVARGDAPEPLTARSFSTFEIRQLVLSVDRLVSRITEANVAKYVAIERAKEADRLKSQFLANMSHDLRSPLNSILGFSELLLSGIDGELSEDQSTMVSRIHESGKSLLQQIDDILDTAKIEASRLDMHPEPTPPATLVGRAIHNARKRQGRDIEYQVDSAPGLPPAFVDPYRTVQAIENVLLFASERMDKGILKVRVRLGKTERGRMIFVQVHTPVRPAAPEHLARARRGFFRIPGHDGLGLGLPIAGAVLELQGGGLGIEDLEEGMTFSLQLCAPEARRATRMRETSQSA